MLYQLCYQAFCLDLAGDQVRYITPHPSDFHPITRSRGLAAAFEDSSSCSQCGRASGGSSK